MRDPGRLAYLYLVLICLVGDATAHTAQEQLLAFTDLHFDPFAEPALVPELAQRPAGEWDAFLDRHAAHELPEAGQDANYFLFDSFLRDASARLPRPRFILFAGDLLGHHFNGRFRDQFPHAGEQALEDFVAATVEFIIGKVSAEFPGVPVVFTLGNNDAFAGDYAILDGGAFLQRTAAPLFDSWLWPMADRDSFFATYQRHGYYSMMLPLQPGAKLISLNAVVFSPHYPWDDADVVAREQLDWLEAELDAAAAAGLEVWLLLHIPPSVDAYATLRAGETRMQWRPAPLERFLTLVRRYSDQLVFAQSGHTHMDDFRLVFGDDRQRASLAFVQITPSLTPVFGNNPGYQLYAFDHRAGRVTGIETFYLDLDEPLCTAVGCRWHQEYGFETAYGDRPDRGGFEALYRALLFDEQERQGYVRRYSVSIDPPAIAEQWRIYRCAIAALTPATFQDRCGALID